MGTLGQDIRYGLRMLARSPGFTALVVVILALGIGATTAMVDVIDAVLLRPCTYKDPESLVCLHETDTDVSPQGQRAVKYITGPTLADFQEWQERNHVFEHLVAATVQADARVPTVDGYEQTRPMSVSPGFFSVLGVKLILGRAFLPEEHHSGSDKVVILSYTHWRHWFAADPNVIGRTLVLDEQVYTVVGVLPRDFRWVFQSRVACGVWLPMLGAAEPTADPSGLQHVIGRLKPGVRPAQAQAEMEVIAAQLGQDHPPNRHFAGISMVPMNEEVARITLGRSKPRVLFMMLGVAAAVLLIACLHIASLLITRSVERGREIVVRAALGAHRLRLIRQLLTESVLLAGLGGLASVVVAYWALGIVSAVRGRSIPWYLGDRTERLLPWFLDVRMGARSLLYIAGVSLLTCVAFGLLPALGVSKVRLNEVLSEGRGQSRAPWFHRLRAALVVLDVALAFVLLVGAGLMANSFTRILRTDLQVNTKNVLFAKVMLHSMDQYVESEAATIAFSRQILEAVAQLPGVQAVAVASGTPSAVDFWQKTIIKEGLAPDEDRAEVRFTEVSADYFRLLQIPLLKGRPFTEYDNEGAPPVAIISESLARQLWPNEDPLGRRLRYLTQDGSNPEPCEIVGVVRDVKHLGDFPDAEVYIPYAQFGGLPAPSVLVRADGCAPGQLHALRREIVRLDPDVPIRELSTLEQQVLDTFSTRQMNALLVLSGFALIALPLAGIGVYGTIAYTVSRRTHEIGIRMALGARSRDVVRAVLRQGLTLTAIGLVLGLGGALAATRVIRSRLYGVTPTDPLTFVCVGLLLAGVALLACYLPARRAARIDPMLALRYE
jgi:predicted permease